MPEFIVKKEVDKAAMFMKGRHEKDIMIPRGKAVYYLIAAIESGRINYVAKIIDNYNITSKDIHHLNIDRIETIRKSFKDIQDKINMYKVEPMPLSNITLFVYLHLLVVILLSCLMYYYIGEKVIIIALFLFALSLIVTTVYIIYEYRIKDEGKNILIVGV